MKKSLILGAALMVVFAVQAMTLSDARAKIGDAVSDAKQMTAVMKELSAADQKAFLAEVNAAIEVMPGSAEAKAATFVAVNRAALKGAAKGTVGDLTATIFKTVPLDYLPAIVESFSKDIYNREMAKMTEPVFDKVSLDLIKKIADETASTDSADERNTLAIVMLAKASGSDNPKLVDMLVSAVIPEAKQDAVKTTTIPAAIQGDYEGAMASEGKIPEISNDLVIKTASPQFMESALGQFVEQDPMLTNENMPQQWRSPILDQNLDSAAQPVVTEPRGYQYQD